MTDENSMLTWVWLVLVFEFALTHSNFLNVGRDAKFKVFVLHFHLIEFAAE